VTSDTPSTTADAPAEREPRWGLALLVGTLMAVVVNVYVFASDYVIVSSRLTFAYLPEGALIPFAVFMMLIVPLARLVSRRAFSRDELIVIFVMTLVGGMFPTLSMVGFIPSMLATPYYFATPENEWPTLLVPHLPKWAFPIDEGGAMGWFFQGMPAGATFPWHLWVMPLLWWLLPIVGLAVASFCGTVLLRRQWVDRERLAFPLARVPLDMVEPGKGRLPAFMCNKLFWIGAGIPLFATAWNLINFFDETFPTLPIFHGSHYVAIGPGFPVLRTKVNLLVMGFAFLTPLEVLFSVWFFHAVSMIETGVMHRFGVSIPWGIWEGLSPMTGWQDQGAFLAFVAISLWMARRHLADVARKAWDPRWEGVDDSKEPLRYRTAVVGLLFGVALVATWMHRLGMGWGTLFVYGIGFFAVYVGISKIVAQCGLPYVRGPVPPQTFAAYTLGSEAIGPAGLIAIASTFAIWCDNKPIMATTMTHTHYVAGKLGRRSRVVPWAVALAGVVAFSLAMVLTLHICYTRGGVTTNCWEIRGGNIWFFERFVRMIRSPQGTDWARMRFMGIGAAGMLILTFLKYRFVWWPLHPIGFAIGGNEVISYCVFSLFLTWLIKAILLKIGGIQAFRKARPFFLGLLLGYALGVGLGFVVDAIWFPGQGHMLHHW